MGSPVLSDIRFLEIHADTWDSGFILWVDGVSFTPQPVCPCIYDMDHDGDVDGGDLAGITLQVQSGNMDVEDLALFATEFGQTDCF